MKQNKKNVNIELMDESFINLNLLKTTVYSLKIVEYLASKWSINNLFLN